MGWLHATPKTERGQAREARIKSYKTPPLPKIEAGAYLRDAFLAVNTGDRLTWTELDAFARLTGAISEPWEAEIVKAMAGEYLAGRHLGEDPFSYAPWEA